ncbi:MAG: demethylmenaquinone methyltransferase/2-methoxy-6-polyprenyl-1,4-benzoquinol methylase [Candidatus Midichloriaceae bacterium]|jgi:demethylmenaquinone methyltransferase/2-methoxy-6-polyprenyl-1,4-benzoquinol methylase
MEVDFGFQKIEKEKKEPKVQKVFSEVADKYDIMNDLMSFGLHRLWKNLFINQIDYFHDKTLLDLAGGTGDIGKKFIDRGGKKAIISDLNQNMLDKGKNNIDDNFNPKYLNDIEWVKANAENLPFKDNSFDYCTISFGIRNVTNIKKAVSESLRVLKPGGKFLCMEFSDIDNKIISKIYELYSFKIIPKIGKIVANSEQSYEYLVQSIKKFYSAEEFLEIIQDSGYKFTKFEKLSFGIVAIHTGYKI